MWREVKVLVIDNNEERRNQIGIVLGFLGEEFLLADEASWSSVCDASVSDPALGADSGAYSPEVLAVIGDCSNTEALLANLKERDQAIPAILLRGSDDDGREISEGALQRMCIGRLTWPATYNKLMDHIHRAQIYREQYDLSRGHQQRREVQLFRSLVGTSRTIQHVREMMAQVADKDASVLITGPSGTGKEVVARNLHHNSPRKANPFVPVNCGAIPAELLESELFGHEKGAFTGAISSRSGRFEMAEGGTLFLDEIGDMPLTMQVKLLRVLQERTYEKVGGTKTLKTDVRIIAATHKNLESMIDEGEFREDLYYRLNVFPIEMPPLKDRIEDVPLLLNELISRLENEKRGSIRFNSAAIMSLCRHEWPGNVRELANLVERMAIMHPYGVVGVQELPNKFRHLEGFEEDHDAGEPMEIPAATNTGMVDPEATALLPVNGIDLKDYLGRLEKSLISQALDDANGVVARAAEKLSLRRTTLVEKMRKLGLSKEKEAN
ncbi:sigma-54 dependent transcriptional regulator [Litoribacillus peritrichatus]|uniref:Transcriptional regulator FleQ n=1 Tax=Litoribacillus peritrichatus TaxID=718191 RepID=A0ABP7M2L2_9GAMM